MADRITIAEVMKLTGKSYKQIRARIEGGTLDAVKEEGVGKRGKWLIDPDSIQPEEPRQSSGTVEQPRNLKDLKTAVEIKKIQQGLIEGKAQILREGESTFTANGFKIITLDTRDTKEWLKKLVAKYKLPQKEIDNFNNRKRKLHAKIKDL